MSNRSRKTIYGIAYALAFLVLLSFLLWKCRYGYANKDEAFYLTIPYRLCRGDSLLLHEWHLSQLSGFLLFPAMKLYLSLWGNTEGILLHFRVVFTLAWAAGALFIFYRLKKFSPLGAALGSLFFLVYTPFGIMALSYNSMGILFLLNACVIASTAEKCRSLQYFFSGIFFAGAVMCCPHLLLLYLLFTLTAVGMGLLRNTKLLRCWLPFSAGCLLLFLLFCASVLPRTSLAKLRDVLPQLFKDPQHQQIPLLEQSRAYVRYILKSSKHFPLYLAVSAAAAVYSKMRKRACSGLIVVCLCSLLLQIEYLTEDPYLNFVMFPLAFVVPYCLLHSRKPSLWIPFLPIWLPGLVYTYCINLASNQKFYAISSAATVMTVASAVILVRFVQDLDRSRFSALLHRITLIAVTLLLALQCYAEISLRYSSVFWEEKGMRAQTVMADSGPERGILMTPAKHKRYKTLEQDVEVIRSREEIRSILFLSGNTYLYLSAEKEMATFSAWLSGVNDISIQRLDTYFSLFPEKTPDGIYLEARRAQYLDRYVERGYRVETLDSGAYLLTREKNAP